MPALAATGATALAPMTWGTTYIVATTWLPPDRPLLAAVGRALPAGLLLLALTRTFRAARGGGGPRSSARSTSASSSRCCSWPRSGSPAAWPRPSAPSSR